jgi:serine/threonine-protein kinase
LGPVFRAYDPEGERLVAVKLFRLDLPPERVHQLVAEFEAVVAARLTHPGIATPVATGILEASAYLAQEFVPAESLDTIIREHGALSVTDALRAAEQLASALDFAAAADVAHGGLHPRDVLLQGDQARLAGLGVVRALERVGAAAPVRRPYTAPERIGGTAWSSRADVFSLAALVHEMLWARRVSGMGQEAVESFTEIAGADLGKVRQAFARALDESPDARFATAGGFVEALKSAFCEQPSARHQSPATSHQSPATSHQSEATSPKPPTSSDQPPATSDQPPATSKNIRQARRAARPPTVDRSEPPVDRRPATDIELRLPLEAPTIFGERELPKVMPASALAAVEPTLPGNWPLAIALTIGVAVGFAAGYGVGMRGRSGAPQPTQAMAVPDVKPDSASTLKADAARGATAAAGVSAAVPPAPVTAAPVAKPALVPAAPVAKPDARAAKVAAAPVVVTGSVVVKSTPAGATVLVDGKDYGRTPLTVRDLAPGAHRVQVARDGFASEDRRVTITAAKSQALTVQLARARSASPAATKPSTAAAPAPAVAGGRGPGPLIVESRPPGAKVFVDGRLVGTTPTSVAGLAAGEHAVQLEHEGYRNWSSSVRIEGSEPSRVTASLEK